MQLHGSFAVYILVTNSNTESEVVVATTDHWNRDTSGFLVPYLQQAAETVRIATGYFTIQGYDLLRDSLAGKKVKILVGYDESSRERLREAVIDNLLAHLRLWDVPNRRDAVQALVNQLQQGELQIGERNDAVGDWIDGRVRYGDHTKVYIIDTAYVVAGSSNLSKSGLEQNIEGMVAVDDPVRVAYWLEKFEQYWSAPDTLSITQALLDALIGWLELDTPFEVYLKTIQALVTEEHIEAPRQTYKMPIDFQWVMINRMLRQLEDYRGAMLVASTGLGKTIMATHAALLMREKKGVVRNVIVFAPKPVVPDWEEALDSAGLNSRIFVRDLLDQPSSSHADTNQRQVDSILSTLERVDEQYLLIIDESHRYTNRYRQDGTERRSFTRLSQVVAERNPYVILLTATPYSKDVDDINNQLYLLPHTAPRDFEFDAKSGLKYFEEFNPEPGVWKVLGGEDFFERFLELPISTVISTAQVAKNFAVQADRGDYIEYPTGQRGWIPQIMLRKVKTPLLLEREIGDALNKHVFRHETISFKDREEWRRTSSTIEKEVQTAWVSSPLALREVVFNTITDGYDVPFIHDRARREEFLMPTLRKLDSISYEEDSKFKELIFHLEQLHEEERKIIIFTERLATAIYLETGIARYLPDLRAANTVRQTESGTYESKSFDEVSDIVVDFAPIANAYKRQFMASELLRNESYDLLISTDAYGVGVNLQDASGVISYDLAWTATPIIQRAGRVLRFWHEPRNVVLYVFVPSLQHTSAAKNEVRRVEERLRRLRRRSEIAEQFSELPIIPQQDGVEYASLSGLSNVKIEDIGLLDNTKIEEFSGVSPFLRHYQAYQENIEQVRNLRDDLTSAVTYKGRVPRVYVLLRHRNIYSWSVMQSETGVVEDIKEDQLLELIECEIDTPIGMMSPNVIEMAAQTCKEYWCRMHQIPQYEVERICALYLVPIHIDHKQLFS